MTPADTLALVMLAELPHLGAKGVARVLQLARERGLRLATVLSLPTAALANDYGLPPQAIARLDANRHDHETCARQLLDRLAAIGARVRQVADEEYPSRWRQRLALPPPLLYLYGTKPDHAAPTLAILNSRMVTEQTVTATAHIARHATHSGFILVTGGMKSTHRIAAVTVRAATAPRVVVLDRGLFATFGAHPDHDPFGLGPGRAVLDTARTLVLSPFRPHDHAAPGNGRRRDELIVGLADIVVAATARPGGEIERACLRALDRGQCVLSWHGENATLLAAGARSVDETELRLGLLRLLLPPVSRPR